VRASAVVFVALMLLSVVIGGRAHLGGDTGGKVAVLRAVDSGEHPSFDVGYWAIGADPELRFHPLYYTALVDDRPQQITTLPMVWVARPLYALGGERAVLAIPMLGAVLAALGAAALARRFGDPTGSAAFWLAALASPVTIYALDVWEHTLGLAGIVWGLVLVIDVTRGRAPWRAALVAGLAFGAAATMRTEALVYGAAFAATGIASLALTRPVAVGRLLRAGCHGGLIASGVVLTWWANTVFEQIVLGASLRSARTADVAGRAGSGLAARLDDAWVTFASLNYADAATDRVLGLAVVIGGAAAVSAVVTRNRRIAAVGAALGVGALGWRLAAGLAFLPGLVPVWPLVPAGVVLGLTDPRARRWVGAAVVGTLLVWLTAYSGMPGAQWGGRYLFALGIVALAAATVGAARLPRVLARLGVAVSIVVTGFGLAYVQQRSGAVREADAAIATATRDADVTISRLPFLWRELGSTYDPSAQHLTVVADDDLRDAAALVADVDARTVSVLQEIDAPAARLVGYRVTDTRRVPWIGRELLAVRYEPDVPGESSSSNA
jgi:hypothetical protein